MEDCKSKILYYFFLFLRKFLNEILRIESKGGGHYLEVMNRRAVQLLNQRRNTKIVKN